MSPESDKELCTLDLGAEYYSGENYDRTLEDIAGTLTDACYDAADATTSIDITLQDPEVMEKTVTWFRYRLRDRTRSLEATSDLTAVLMLDNGCRINFRLDPLLLPSQPASSN